MKNIILDTDYSMGHPGSDVDDGFALALAHVDPRFELHAVTTVFGNAPLSECTRLVAEGLAHLSEPATVFAGAHRPVLHSSQEETETARSSFSRNEAVLEICRRINDSPGKYTIVAIGPLTNIALALLLDPGIAGKVVELIIMGGAFTRTTGTGTTWPGEFNIWNDPVAAQVVLDSTIPQRWVGLDVTTRVRLSRDQISTLPESSVYSRTMKRAANAWMDFLSDEYPDQYGRDDVEIHDATAVAAVVHPELFTWAPAYVQVSTANNETRGLTIADFGRLKNPTPPNCTVAVDVDVEALTEFILGSLREVP